LKVDDDLALVRNGKVGDAVTLDIYLDGKRALSRNAAGEMECHFFRNTPGSIVHAFVARRGERVSNVVRYVVPAQVLAYGAPRAPAELNDRVPEHDVLRKLTHHIDLDADNTVQRTGDLGEKVGWVVVRNGRVVLHRLATKELTYRYTSTRSGDIVHVYLNAPVGGYYQRVSNIVRYEVP
jgi:hypothetical protein